MNVKINVEKLKFLKAKMPYLGYLLTSEGIKPNPDKTKPIAQMANSDSFDSLRSFLGMATYYSRFISGFANMASALYDLLKEKTFKWESEDQQAKNIIVNSILNSPVLKCFRMKTKSTVTVDASKIAIGAVLEQENHPILFISRKLSQSEIGYSQTMKEALAIIWAVKRLHKYVYGTMFDIVTDHKALKFIFSPTRITNSNSLSMLSRWAISLSIYNYNIIFKKGSEIPTADFLSRFAFHDKSDNLHFVCPFPISRNLLIQETRKAFGGILSSVQRGWSNSMKKRHPELYKRRELLSVSPDNVISFEERILVPPTLRQELLQYLHCNHMGRDKMLSSARSICWWPNLAQDITSLIKDCQPCGFKPKLSQLSNWPFSLKPMQRIHVDYCGPFINNYNALIIMPKYF